MRVPGRPRAEAARFVKKLRDRGMADLVLGCADLATPAFAAWFESEAAGAADPGQYADGVLAVSRFLPDLVGAEAHAFVSAPDAESNRRANARAAGAYDCAGLIVRAAPRLDFAKPLPEQRHALRDALASFDAPARAVAGATGEVYFDRHGRALRPIPVGRYLGRNLVPALTQLYPLYHSDEQPNLQAWLKEGRAVDAGQFADAVTAPYFVKTRIVFAGCRVHKVTNFSPETLTAELELLLWVRFEGGDPVDKIVFRNSVEPLTLGKPVEEEGAGPGLRYQRYHVKGRFHGDFTTGLHDRDRHELGLSFHHQVLGRDELWFVPDRLGMGLASPDGLARELTAARVVELPSPWRLDGAGVYAEVVPENSLGRPGHAGGTEDFSCLTLQLAVARGPTTLVGRLPAGWAVYLTLACVVAVCAIEWRYRRHPAAALAVTAGVLAAETLLLVTLLLTSERACYEALGDALSQALSVQVERLFAIAGWLVGGLLVYTAINRFLFIPVEVRTERPIPSVVRRFIILVLLAVAVCGGLSFVYDRQLTGILATSGIIAMVIGLAVQMNISNLFAGLAIHFEPVPRRRLDPDHAAPRQRHRRGPGDRHDLADDARAHQGLLDPVHPQQPGGRECRLQLQLARPDVPVQGRHQDQRRPPARQGREAPGRCGLARPGRSAGTAADVPHSPGGAGRRRRVRVDFLLPGHRQRERHPPERVAERLAPPAERGHRLDQERVGPAQRRVRGGPRRRSVPPLPRRVPGRPVPETAAA